MRISDWSSDVCSSDLIELAALVQVEREAPHRSAGFPCYLCSRPLGIPAAANADGGALGRQRRRARAAQPPRRSEQQGPPSCQPEVHYRSSIAIPDLTLQPPDLSPQQQSHESPPDCT